MLPSLLDIQMVFLLLLLLFFNLFIVIKYKSITFPILIILSVGFNDINVSDSHSVVPDFVTPWTIARQAPLSMEFFREGYWTGLPFPSPRDLPDPGVELECPELQADSLPSEPPGKLIIKRYF